MKKYEKDIAQQQLEHEKEVIAELKEMYEEAEKELMKRFWPLQQMNCCSQRYTR